MCSEKGYEKSYPVQVFFGERDVISNISSILKSLIDKLIRHG